MYLNVNKCVKLYFSTNKCGKHGAKVHLILRKTYLKYNCYLNKFEVMLYLTPSSTNVYFNLAAEEYLLKNFSDDIFILWQNEPSVVVGKFQNIAAEVNQNYAYQKQIKLARRFSGGGAVYHDLGNLNFTFIENSGITSFSRFANRMAEYLHRLGIDVLVDERNALWSHGIKISGSAQSVHKHRVLYHGTLLFSSDLEKLTSVLDVSSVAYRDKAVRSVRNTVGNIIEHLYSTYDIEAFKENLLSEFKADYPDAMPYSYKRRDVEMIEQLASEKYATWDWIFGRSPAYIFNKTIFLGSDLVDVLIEVENGCIVKIESENTIFSGLDKYLHGCKHNLDAIKQRLTSMGVQYPLDLNLLTKAIV